MGVIMTADELRRKSGGGLFDLIGKVFSMAGWIDLAMELVPLIKEWNDIEEPITIGAGLKARLAVLVRAGKAVTAQTANVDDDALVAQLEKLAANDGLIDFIASVIARYQAANPNGSPAALLAFIERPDMQESLAEEAAERALDLGMIMEAIKLIMQLIAMFRGATGGSGAASDNNGWNF
jgi:hypothetical protein